jgi:transcriptional regulator of heat shock response
MDITQRQRQLLLSIISEFINTAEAVGSISLQNKYNFKVSPATIRNEMAELVLMGYLFQKHNSGGRIPTTKGWRFFVETLDTKELKDLDVATKQTIKEDLIKTGSHNDDLIRHSIKYLSQISGNAAIALIDREIYYAGLSEIVNIPEFKESGNLRKILTLLEDYYSLSEILNKGEPDEDINILIGEEAEINEFKDYAVIFSELRVAPNQKGYIAVIGPNRMRYNIIIPAMRYISETIKQIVKDN